MMRVLLILLAAGMALGGCDPVFASPSVVEVARSQLGKGEVGGDNKGPVVREYTGGQEVAWCSGFVSWVMRRAGKDSPYVLSARQWWAVKEGSHVRRPRPGDIAVFWRGKKDGQLGHVGIVEAVDGDRVTTIEGNVGNYPAKVKRVTYKIGKMKNFIGFVRISGRGAA